MYFKILGLDMRNRINRMNQQSRRRQQFSQQKKSSIKYAVMVPIDDDSDMLYVTEGDTKFQLRAKLFDTEQQAKEHAELWGEHAVVVEYTKESAI
jgi:hypothetical protein